MRTDNQRQLPTLYQAWAIWTSQSIVMLLLQARTIPLLRSNWPLKTNRKQSSPRASSTSTSKRPARIAGKPSRRLSMLRINSLTRHLTLRMIKLKKKRRSKTQRSPSNRSNKKNRKTPMRSLLMCLRRALLDRLTLTIVAFIVQLS